MWGYVGGGGSWAAAAGLVVGWIWVKAGAGLPHSMWGFHLKHVLNFVRGELGSKRDSSLRGLRSE